MDRSANSPPNSIRFDLTKNKWVYSVCEHETCVKFGFKYTLKDFVQVVRKRDYNHAIFKNDSSFSAEELPELKWKLTLEDDRWMGLIFSMFPHKPESSADPIPLPCPVRIRLSILTQELGKIMTEEYSYPTNTQTPLRLQYICHEDEAKYHLINRSTYLVFQNSKDLTIWCDIETWTAKNKIVTSNTKENSQKFHAYQTSNCVELVNQFEKLFNNMTFSDVVFNIRGSIFRAHICILSARSPVFAAMFDHKTQEKLSQYVLINDIEPEVFQEALRFIYTGQIHPTQMRKIGVELLAVADKYLLDNLKSRCEESLVIGLSAENCLNMFVVADLHSLGKLKQSVLNLIRLNQTELMATVSWAEFKQKEPNKFLEIHKLL